MSYYFKTILMILILFIHHNIIHILLCNRYIVIVYTYVQCLHHNPTANNYFATYVIQLFNRKE